MSASSLIHDLIHSKATQSRNLFRRTELGKTGEGRLDSQSCMGKAPVGVAWAAKKYGKTVIAFCGSAKEDAALCNEYGIDAFFPIIQTPTTLAEAMNKDNAYRNLKATAEQTFRLIGSIKK